MHTAFLKVLSSCVSFAVDAAWRYSVIVTLYIEYIPCMYFIMPAMMLRYV